MTSNTSAPSAPERSKVQTPSSRTSASTAPRNWIVSPLPMSLLSAALDQRRRQCPSNVRRRGFGLRRRRWLSSASRLRPRKTSGGYSAATTSTTATFTIAACRRRHRAASPSPFRVRVETVEDRPSSARAAEERTRTTSI